MASFTRRFPCRSRASGDSAKPPNGMVRTSKGTLNIQARELVTIVTAVKGDATLLLEGEEKKLLEGRQHKMSIGGEPVDIGAIINWSEGVLTGDGKKD